MKALLGPFTKKWDLGGQKESMILLRLASFSRPCEQRNPLVEGRSDSPVRLRQSEKEGEEESGPTSNQSVYQ